MDLTEEMADIKNNLRVIREALPDNVKLVAVSKFRPIEELEQAYAAGQRVFAEARPAEFKTKHDSLPGDIQWHFIGHLQTNKIKLVIPYASLVHSVDSLHLLDEIQDFCASRSIVSNVLLEVHVAMEETKQGFSRQEILSENWEKLQETKYRNVRICGIMGMASNTDDTSRIEADFDNIREIFLKVREANPGLTDFSELSMGMSHDWKIALRHGTTMVRIGSFIFLDNNN